MAKYRHRIFEMYEFRDEATRALTPKSARPDTEATAPESWTFKHLAVSRSASVTHVRFKRAQTFGEETVGDLREDLSQLADRLVRDSRVLFNFAGVMSFGSASIEALALFNRTLQIKGSQIALCCLDLAVHQSFFRRSNGHEKRK
jgi:anti-anti-sigma regulatory factor